MRPAQWVTQRRHNSYRKQLKDFTKRKKLQLTHDVMVSLARDQQALDLTDVQIASVFDGAAFIPWDLIHKYEKIYNSRLFLTHDCYEGDPPELADVQVCSQVAWANGPAVNSYSNVWRHSKAPPSNESGWRERVIWDYCINRVTGNIWAEFGVALGGSASFFLGQLPEDGKMYLLDSWEGLPEEWHGNPRGHFACDPPDFGDPRAVIVKGWFEDTAALPDVLDFVHIDCDLYSSTKTILNSIKVRPGTIILFDELWGYEFGFNFVNEGWQEGEYKALMEWDRPYRFIARDTRGRAAIEVL
jgi:hypothetical protein